MKHYYFVYIIVVTCFLSCKMQKITTNNKMCATKYPIIFVHGLGLRDDLKLIKYWSNIPKTLSKHGATVFYSKHDALNSYVESALQLRETVLNVLDSTKAEKVNLIAHSKGGIDSRFLISRLGMSDKVASLTSISSPHRGSSLADSIIHFLNRKGVLHKVIHFLNNYAHFFGDYKPDALSAGYNLTREYMVNFNNSVPNIESVYYQSYGSVVSDKYPNIKVRLFRNLIYKTEGDNDSNVSINSCRWGNFRGLVTNQEQSFGISHHDIIGMKFMNKQSTFNSTNFMINIVADLKLRGF